MYAGSRYIIRYTERRHLTMLDSPGYGDLRRFLRGYRGH